MKNPVYCIKPVPYQELVDLRDTLERLESWQEPLRMIDKYFTHPQHPINKKQVVKQYYAYAQVFQTFHKTYHQLLQDANQRLEKMTQHQTMEQPIRG